MLNVKVVLKSNVEKPQKTFPIHTSEFMNKVNERAKATDPKYVGIIDELFFDYYMYAQENNIEMNSKTWKEFHNNKKNTKKAKVALNKKLREMKAAIRSINRDMMEEWYDFFLYEQTFYGKSQEFLIKDYFEKKGALVEIERPKIAGNKIDLVINGISCQVKPYDSRNPNQNRPIDDNITYIYYRKRNNEIDFYWESTELDKIIEKKGEKNERN